MASATALRPPSLCQHRLAAATGVPRGNHERNHRRSWNDFYRRHQNKFFKDRHYLEKDWGHYFEGSSGGSGKVVLEVGCGAGNTLFPLRAVFPDVFIHACDLSHHAIALVKNHEAFTSGQMDAFVCDVTKDDLCKKIRPASVDVVTMIFMLSAVSPVKMPSVIQNVKAILKPGGHLLFRDYAMGDFAQEKLASKSQQISENFYARGDGTCAFYFSEDSLSNLFEENGFIPSEVCVYCKQIVNRSRKVSMNRLWIRGEFSRVDDPDS